VVLVAIAATLFFLPIWVGSTLTYAHWHLRMWFDSWI